MISGGTRIAEEEGLSRWQMIKDASDQWLTQIEHTCSCDARCGLGNFHFPDQRCGAAPCQACTSASDSNSLTCPFVLAFRQRYTGGTQTLRAGSALRRIETTSCAVDAEGHLNAVVVVEVVTTFSSFQVP
jgi:hypothetical protein